MVLSVEGIGVFLILSELKLYRNVAPLFLWEISCTKLCWLCRTLLDLYLISLSYLDLSLPFSLSLSLSLSLRCGGMFCALHRYAETHSCTFDYKGEGRRLIARDNPIVMAPKLPKI